jgi:hypothetical protein
MRQKQWLLCNIFFFQPFLFTIKIHFVKSLVYFHWTLLRCIFTQCHRLFPFFWWCQLFFLRLITFLILKLLSSNHSREILNLNWYRCVLFINDLIFSTNLLLSLFVVQMRVLIHNQIYLSWSQRINLSFSALVTQLAQVWHFHELA